MLACLEITLWHQVFLDSELTRSTEIPARLQVEATLNREGTKKGRTGEVDVSCILAASSLAQPRKVAGTLPFLPRATVITRTDP